MPGRSPLAGILTLLAVVMAGCSGDPPPPDAVPSRPLVAADPGVLRVAGSGAFTPLARRLADAFAKRGGQPRVVVEESLGSGGGIAAAAEGALDLGLVSRPLSKAEQGKGLRVLEVAVDAVVIAANGSVAVDGLSSDELRALYAGQVRTFANGSSAVVLLRDRGESANAALVAAVPGLRISRDAEGDERQLRVLFHDSSMLQALVSTPGGLGVSALGLTREVGPALKVLDLDGVTPSLQSLEDGTWPARRTLAIVGLPERMERAQAFLDFVLSDEGAALARAAYVLPVGAR